MGYGACCSCTWLDTGKQQGRFPGKQGGTQVIPGGTVAPLPLHQAGESRASEVPYATNAL